MTTAVPKAKVDKTQEVLGAMLVGILTGKLTDEVIALVDTINRPEEPLGHLVGFIHGMDRTPSERRWFELYLLDEVRIICEEQKEKLKEET